MLICWLFLLTIDEVHPAEVASLVDGVEAEVTLLSLAGVAGGPHYHPLHVAQPALVIGVVRV